MTRLTVIKTYKLYVNGKFPRSESGRSLPVKGRSDAVLGHVSHASRKDLRDTVEAARAGQKRWGSMTAYNRGQVLYRMAEMMEGKREDFARLIADTVPGGVARARKEVDAAIDRLVCFAGWTDKFMQILGAQNPVAGPYYNMSVAEPVGLVGVVCPDEPALLGLITMLAPPLSAGNAVCLIAGDRHPLPAAVLGEVCASSDVPPGVINILTGRRAELLEHLATHREVDAISAANLKRTQNRILRAGAADNVKRVHVAKIKDDDWYDADACESPWNVEPFVEIKTIWHPMGA